MPHPGKSSETRGRSRLKTPLPAGPQKKKREKEQFVKYGGAGKNR